MIKTYQAQAKQLAMKQEIFKINSTHKGHNYKAKVRTVSTFRISKCDR